MRPGAARSGCARAGTRRMPGAAPGRWSITEIPWLVQKSRLVEKIAELLNDKKLPLVADVRDELAEDMRLVIEPRARTVDAELMMELLFKLTELESRIPLNMNVLVKGKIPKVLGLAEVVARMARPPPRRAAAPQPITACARSTNRLEVLGGYLIAYLNLDRGHQDHPHRGRAQAGADDARSSFPTCRPKPFSTCGCAICASSRSMEIRAEDRRSARRASRRCSDLVASEPRPVEEDRGRDQGGAHHVRAEDAARQAAHHVRAGAGA